MKKIFTLVSVLVVIGGLAVLVMAEVKEGKSGEELFKEHCAVCHPDGGNIINPEKTLRKADLDAHNIREKADIVDKMRHPGKGMTTWSAAIIPDKDAEAIADYILKTFK